MYAQNNYKIIVYNINAVRLRKKCKVCYGCAGEEVRTTEKRPDRKWKRNKQNIFNPISVNDVYNVDEATKEAMSKRAIDNGILERAQDNAQSLIRSILEMNPTLQEGYTVVFDVQLNPTPSPAPTQQPAEDAQD